MAQMRHSGGHAAVGCSMVAALPTALMSSAKPVFINVKYTLCEMSPAAATIQPHTATVTHQEELDRRLALSETGHAAC